MMSPLLTTGPPMGYKFGFFDHNIWALAVTTLTTKVSTRYIHSPLRWILHISPLALEINEQQIIYRKYALCWITVAGDRRDLYRSLSTQIMHSQHLQVTGDSLWAMADMDVWVCVWCAVYIELQYPFITSFPPKGLNNDKENFSKIYYNSPLFFSLTHVQPLQLPERCVILHCWPTQATVDICIDYICSGCHNRGSL